MRTFDSFSDALETFRNRRSVLRDPVRRAQAAAIVADVRAHGDEALRRFTLQFDGVTLNDFALPAAERTAAAARVATVLRDAIDLAIERVRSFYGRQVADAGVTTTAEGTLGQLIRPLERVGVYVPSGAATLVSSLIMTAVPAQVAGVEEIVVVTPPRADGSVDDALLYAAERLGLQRIYRLGGAQAVAAVAFGTRSIPKVDLIVGPGSPWVVHAMAEVFGEVGIASLPGPTETLIVADDSADPEHVAADLLAQAEHAGAEPVLVTTDPHLWPRVEAALERRLADLPTAATARESLNVRGSVAVAADMQEAMALANAFAPEHLCLLTRDPWGALPQVKHAGGIFLGAHSLEALGDYMVGPSHVMPTGGTARFSSAINVRDFQRVVPLIALTEAGAQALGAAAAVLARAEGLEAHARAIESRLPSQQQGG